MAKTEYRQFLSTNNVVSSGQSRDAEMVKRVGSRIATAITSYYKGKGLGSELEGYQWEYNLVNDKSVNAWCMPGGKIVVYTGLLPITQNEAALAVVIGHEIAHAVARHGNERMSQGLLQQLGGAALSVALANKPEQTQGLFMQAYGIGSAVGVTLPHSRNQEYEADKLGLIYAALAGMARPRRNSPLKPRNRIGHVALKRTVNNLVKFTFRHAEPPFAPRASRAKSGAPASNASAPFPPEHPSGPRSPAKSIRRSPKAPAAAATLPAKRQ